MFRRSLYNGMTTRGEGAAAKIDGGIGLSERLCGFLVEGYVGARDMFVQPYRARTNELGGEVGTIFWFDCGHNRDYCTENNKTYRKKLAF